jgi:hypothetical protein
MHAVGRSQARWRWHKRKDAMNVSNSSARVIPLETAEREAATEYLGMNDEKREGRKGRAESTTAAANFRDPLKEKSPLMKIYRVRYQ